jgi:hypothetical protein
MFVICSHCRRHYRHIETACPFCSSSKSGLTRRLGMSFAVALGVTSTFGCAKDTDNEPTGAGGTAGAVGSATGGQLTPVGGGGNGGYAAGSSNPTPGVCCGGTAAIYGPPPGAAGSDWEGATGPTGPTGPTGATGATRA